MFLEVLRFELYYRLKRPATWIYFGLMLLLAFGGVAWENISIGGGTGQVKENAPAVIAFMMVILTTIPGFFFASAIMGVPVLRDFEHNTGSMLYTTPLRQSHYLWGRFLGSFLVTLLVFSGMLVGLILGSMMPWLDPEKFLPFNFWHYLQPFLAWVVPNALFSGALFFMGGTLSRKLLWVFMQGAMLLMFYLITGEMASELENRTLSILLDPMGIGALDTFTQYWTVSERNSRVIPVEGTLLVNRLLWVGLGIGALALTFWRFSYTTAGTSGRRRKAKASGEEHMPAGGSLVLPQVTLHDGLKTNLQRIAGLSRIYFLEIVKSLPFIGITFFGIVLLLANAWDFEAMYGTDTYPTTYLMLQQLSGFNIFFLVLIVFYSGELVWRERDLKMNQIFDTLPIPGFVSLTAKFLSMVYMFVVLLLVLMFTGILVQVTKGYFQFEIGVYLGNLFTDTLIFLVLFALFSFFVQVLTNQKFLAHALVILYFLASGLVFDEIGMEHRMFKFASASLGTYSDMNTYGHFVPAFSWFNLYWIGFAFLLFALAVTFSVRGVDTVLKTRAKLARQRFARPVLVFTAAAFLLFAGSGCYIFYNTTVLNEYRNSDEGEELRANYEKTLKKYQDLPQPRIVETRLKVDIFPYQRDFTAEGYYILKNKTAQPIEALHLTTNAQVQGLQSELLGIERLDSLGGAGMSLDQSWPEYGYHIYTLERPLAPGDSLKLDWKVALDTKGFVEGGSNTSVVFNGTFFNNTYFPGLGYEPGGELSSDDDRKDYDLPERADLGRARTDSVGRRMNLIGDDADNLRFGITMSTAADQIAIAPGYLQKEWTEGERRYFQYEMDVPMFNFYAMISARYEVRREQWETPSGKPVNLEIYHHPTHTYNLDRMMQAMKDALAYYDRHFSPYQFRQMRIMEFPRYASFAQSFANTVPFSEGIGFILNVEEEDVDVAYYVTAHEMAHQWWGHQVSEASVRGSAAISETLSQYSALMVMKQQYGPEMMQTFLKYELDSYLRGRAGESKKEYPLAETFGQSYIHYRKGSVVMYALQDYIGEDSINAALASFADKWAFREDLYPTTFDLIAEFRAVTPDTLQYLIDDMWETITLYENRVEEVTYEALPDGQYQVDLTYSALKYRADSLGNETQIDMRDWIDFGVYGETEAGKDTLLYLQKHRVTGGEKQTLTLKVDQKPTKAGIDPINKLIDRNSGDNVKEAKAAGDIL